MTGYYAPPGGLPPQTALMTGRAVFTTAYAVIPKGCFSDIVTSYLPGWDKTRLWLIARPMSGFSETFSQYVMEVAPGGGSDAPDAETGAEHWLFFTEGLATLTIDGTGYEMEAGCYAYIPAGSRWTLLAEGKAPARFHWLRKIYEPAPGVARARPPSSSTNATCRSASCPTPTSAGAPPALSIPTTSATTPMSTSSPFSPAA